MVNDVYLQTFLLFRWNVEGCTGVQKIANEPTQSNVNWAAYSTTLMLLAIRTLIIIVIGDEGVQVCPSIIRSTFTNEYKIQELSEAGISILFSAM